MTLLLAEITSSVFDSFDASAQLLNPLQNSLKMASTTALGDGPVTPTVTFNATGTPWPSPQSNAAINNDDDPPSGVSEIGIEAFASSQS